MNTWHCVRCHCTYTRADNVNAEAMGMTCTVPHVWGPPIILPSSLNFSAAATKYIREAVCCPGVYTTEIHSAGGVETESVEPCFKGRHTTNPNTVPYNNQSVKPCQAAHY